MGAYKYIQEQWRKKQSYVICFVLRVNHWCSTASYVIYQIRVQHGDHKCLVPKGATYGKPVHLGERAEHYHGGSEGLEYLQGWRRYKFFKVILLNPFYKAVRRNPGTQWVTKPYKSHGSGECHKFHHTISGSCLLAWRKHNILQVHHYW
ncbi:unnamed protein product [Nyctereutes procyonoides]|uniref:Large ribosomal subunit protein eL15 n=1 Tax=Nyctereutes procyonoides TaxID=34880 RepID=A0A811Y2W8_NYCPR|nr:unnamed protein product [Nyctereutes procyonoides]